MILIDKIVKRLNRKWEIELETFAESLKDLPEMKPEVEIESIIQPTHLSYRGKKRPIRRRRSHGKRTRPIPKEQSLNSFMKQELLKLAK